MKGPTTVNCGIPLYLKVKISYNDKVWRPIEIIYQPTRIRRQLTIVTHMNLCWPKPKMSWLIWNEII